MTLDLEILDLDVLSSTIGIEVDVLPELIDRVNRTLLKIEGRRDEYSRAVTRLVAVMGDELREFEKGSTSSTETLATGLVSAQLLATMVADRLDQEVTDTNHYAEQYSGRIVMELVQNLHDAVAHVEGLQLIGEFGLGVKGMGRLLDGIELDSGPFRLRFEPDVLRKIRPDLAGMKELPIFLLPVPDTRMRRPGKVPVGADTAIGLEKHSGRWWLWTWHAGKPFSCADVDGFRRRRASGKSEWCREQRQGASTMLRFRLRSNSAREQVEKALGELDARSLLFLPALRSLLIRTPSGERTLRLATEVAPSPLSSWEIVRCRPRRGTWLRRVEGPRGIAIPLDATAWAGVRQHSLVSWFPIRELQPELPFLLHDGGLTLTDNRESLAMSEGNRIALTELGRWAAGRIVELCARESFMGTDKLLFAFATRLPQSVLPDRPASVTPAVSRADDAPPSPRTAKEATELLRSIYVASLRERDAPLLPVWGEVAPVTGGSALWIAREDRNDASEVAEYLHTASGGRKVVGRQGARWIEDSLLDPGHPFGGPDRQETFFRDLRGLDGAMIVSALTGIAAELRATTSPIVEDDRLVPIGPRDPLFDAVLALCRLLGARVNEVSERCPDWLPIPVMNLDGPKPRVILLPERDLDMEVRETLRRAGTLLAAENLPDALLPWFRIQGLVDPRWDQILIELGEQADELGDRCTQSDARAMWRLAVLALQRLSLDVRRGEPHPLARVVHDLSQIPGWKLVRPRPWEDRYSPVWLALSRLRLPVLNGKLRPASELSLDDGTIVHRRSLRVDVDEVREWMGEAEEAQTIQYLRAAGVWAGLPLIVRIRRLDGQSTADASFETFLERWTPPPGWWDWIPGADGDRGRSPEAADRRAPRRSLAADAARLPLQSAGVLHGETLRTHWKDPWYRAGGHHQRDMLAVVVDAPPEIITPEGRVQVSSAQHLMDSLANAEGEAGDHEPVLSWSWFVDPVDAARISRSKFMESRVSARGDLPSPLLARLRDTEFLEPHPQSRRAKELKGAARRIAPRVATWWPMHRLDVSPARLLPVARLEAWEARLLGVVAPISELKSESRGAIADPRWVIATLLRLRSSWDGGELDEQALPLARIVARLLEHIAHALGLHGPSADRSGPSTGETWAQFYQRVALQSGDGLHVRLGSWFADARMTGFLAMNESTSDLNRLGKADPTRLIGQLPLFVRRKDGGEFHTIEEVRGGEAGLVAADEPADVQRQVQAQLGLVAFPDGYLTFARFLQLPIFQLDEPRLIGRKARDEPLWAQRLKTLVHTALPWLVEAAGSFARNPDQLRARAALGIEFVFADRLGGTRGLRGIPGERWGIERGDLRFRCVRKAKLSTGRSSRCCIAVRITPNLDDIRGEIEQLADPLAEALGLDGPAPRWAMEYVLHRCAESRAWEALQSKDQPLPDGLLSFLGEKGWVDVNDERPYRVFARLFARLLESLALPMIDVPAEGADEARTTSTTDLRDLLAEALQRRWPGEPFSASELRVDGEEGDQLPTTVVARVVSSERIEPEQLREALAASGARLDSLVNGTRIEDVWEALLAQVGPYVEVLRRVKLLGAGTPFETLEVGRYIWSDARDLAAAMGRDLQQQIEDPSLGASVADALSAVDPEHALEMAFKLHGLPTPGIRERRRERWRQLLDQIAGDERGAASMAVLDPTDFGGDLSTRYLRWRSPRERAREIDWLLGQRVPEAAVDRAALAELLGYPGQGGAGDLSDPIVVILEIVREVGDEPAVQRLLSDRTRSVRVLDQRFSTEQDAARELDRKRAELEALTPEFAAGPEPTSAEPEVSEQESKVPAGSGGHRTFFSPRAGLVGREGERYVRQLLMGQYVTSVVSEAVTIEVFDVSTPEAVAAAMQDPRVQKWLGKSPIDRRHPGFDLLWHFRRGTTLHWDGIEVKASVDPQPAVMAFQWTSNEHDAAMGAKHNAWPVDRHHICCVCRLWHLDQGVLQPPQVLWLSDPADLEQANRIKIEPRQSVSWIVRLRMAT